jgi:hypothetical protein
MKKILLYASILLFIINIPYTQASNTMETTLRNALQVLNLDNPKEDLTTKIGRDDLRFIGLYGYAVFFPGVNQKDYPLIDKYGILMIEGTSDAIESEEHAELIDKAILYGEIYNTALLSHIKKHNVILQEGYVPNKETAIKIAVAVWIPIYGEKDINNQKPYKAVLEHGIWFVSGSLQKGLLGGTAEAEIIKENGKIIRVSHGK